jgi:isoaspartyl peptidase/L-asparaginase-like protein (Ntn-hydrolase superfamily)
VRHPVLAARAVMERTPHVMLSGEGAEAVAREAGLEFCEESWFQTPDRRAALDRVRRAAEDAAVTVTEQDRHGTVGAVALDRDGHVAAATSTGGRANKLPGRVGDSPLIGAGTYADDGTAAISCTGAGEQFMRVVVAHRIAMRMELLGESLAAASAESVRALRKIGGGGGLIAVSADGSAASPFTGDGMHRGIVRAGGAPVTAIFAGEDFPADLAFA